MKVLVVGPSWIGDTILAQPLLALLHERRAGITLDILAPAWTFPVVERMPEVHQAIASPFAHGELMFSERRTLGRALRGERYDQAIVLPNTLKSAFVPWFARIPRRTGYRGEMRWGMLNDVRTLDEQGLPQMAQRYAALGLEPGEPVPAVLPPPHLESSQQKCAETLQSLGVGADRPIVALCPGAEYGPAKRWPPSYFAEVARALARRGDRVLLVGSARDAEIARDIVRLSGMSPHATIIKLDVPCSPCFERTCPLGHFNCMMNLKPERVLTVALASARR
jgi:heptosyltransferase-2